MKVVIIGAGPAGLACAYELAKKNIEVEVHELTLFNGGMARTIDLWGQKVDLGPHRFFSKNNRVNNFFFDVLGDEYVSIKRKTRIYFNKRFYNYPLDVKNIILNFNLFEGLSIISSYILQKFKNNNNPENFEEWVISKFGKRLYNIFFKSYTEKLWGISCNKIDSSWASQRIRNLSLWRVFKSVLFNNNEYRTLINYFNYPKYGAGSLYDKVASRLTMNGIKIFYKSKIVEIFKKNTKIFLKLDNNRIVETDYLVSTMPLTTLANILKDVPYEIKSAANQLYYRNTILVYLEIDKSFIFEDNWIYIHDNNVKTGRITNFRNWSLDICQDMESTILCLEYWAFDNDDIWNMNSDSLIQLAKKELLEIVLITDIDLITNAYVHKIPKCYPVYETGYEKALEMVKEHLSNYPEIIPIGRAGSFKYNNQDHSILMGLMASDQITGSSDMNLWELNSNSEYQEE